MRCHRTDKGCKQGAAPYAELVAAVLEEPKHRRDNFQYDIVSNMKSFQDDDLHDALMLLQCEFVAQRKRVNPADITWLQYDILSSLRSGATMPSSLSVQLGISRSKLSKSLGELKSLGFIEQTPSAHDRRELQTSLSDKGLHLLHDIDDQHHELTESAVSVWSPEEQRSFANLATELVSVLREQRKQQR